MMKYDAIVVGAGHAGCEAALILAKLKKKTLLITISLDNIAKMSCNPSIGGLAKGHLVKEIDALGGIMGQIIDKTGIQFRMLNRSKGPAVWGPRAQADRNLYLREMKRVIEENKYISLIEGEVSELLLEGNEDKKKINGVTIQTDESFYAENVLLCCGTFLRGKIHIGNYSTKSGRAWEKASNKLSVNLEKLNFKLLRFKTGTPARVNGNSIDFRLLRVQSGDNITHFSHKYKRYVKNSVKCYITNTHEKTIEIVKKNLNKSALVAGRIKGLGPRYCPSIEDKVIRFPDNLNHQIFLEPEGLDTNEFYVNGISTSLPFDVQNEIVKSIKGLENAQITRPGYAIEYDCINSTCLKQTLESKEITGLYFAGQINGTSGYEEAAAQGLVAGINISNKIDKMKDFVLKRNEAYIGVLIDDLVTKGTNEPYRLFTSRAEYRLFLRYDNAYERLIKYSERYNLLDVNTINYFKQIYDKKTTLINYLNNNYVNYDKKSKSLAKILRQPDIHLEDIYKLDKNVKLDNFDFDQLISIEVDVKYEGYLKKQLDEVNNFIKYENIELNEVKYAEIKNLTNEAIEKLDKIKPATIGQAMRISGISPADIINLLIYMKMLKKRKK